MKILSLVTLVVLLCLLAVCSGRPGRRWGQRRHRGRTRSGQSWTTGRATGTETDLNTRSNVNAGEEGGEASSSGSGTAQGGDESQAELESRSELDGRAAGAGGLARGTGEKTETGSEAETSIGYGAQGSSFERSRSRSLSRGRAWGRGGGAVDMEAFGGIDRWRSGNAGGGGKATGVFGEIFSQSEVNILDGGNSKVTSRGRGRASSQRGSLSAVEIEQFGGIDQSEAESGVLALGQETAGKSQAGVIKTADGRTISGAESEGSSVASGRGGVRSNTRITNGRRTGSANSEAKGQGDLVESWTNSKLGLSGRQGAGQSASGANASGRGTSFAESRATVYAQGQ